MTMLNKNAPAFQPALVQEELYYNEEEFDEEVELYIFEEELKKELQEDEDEELRKKLAISEKKKPLLVEKEWSQEDYYAWKASEASKAS